MRRRKFDSVLKSVSTLLRTLAHPDRLRLIGILQNEELDVSHLSEAMAISQSLVSQHLRLLKMQGLVVERREGKHVYYRLRSPLVKYIVTSAIELQAQELPNDPETIALLEEMKSLWEDRTQTAG
jgi:DNA-binding transcriptional ArsR family regulator